MTVFSCIIFLKIWTIASNFKLIPHLNILQNFVQNVWKQKWPPILSCSTKAPVLHYTQLHKVPHTPLHLQPQPEYPYVAAWQLYWMALAQGGSPGLPAGWQGLHWAKQSCSSQSRRPLPTISVSWFHDQLRQSLLRWIPPRSLVLKYYDWRAVRVSLFWSGLGPLCHFKFGIFALYCTIALYYPKRTSPLFTL